MTLMGWIDQTGARKVARLLNVDPSTVSCWRLHKALPHADRMVTIFKLSGGKVTYQEMIETHSKKHIPYRK